jgi:hypothetical protein
VSLAPVHLQISPCSSRICISMCLLLTYPRLTHNFMLLLLLYYKVFRGRVSFGLFIVRYQASRHPAANLRELIRFHLLSCDTDCVDPVFRPPHLKVSSTFAAALDMLSSVDDELVPSAEGTVFSEDKSTPVASSVSCAIGGGKMSGFVGGCVMFDVGGVLLSSGGGGGVMFSGWGIQPPPLSVPLLSEQEVGEGFVQPSHK